MKTCVLFSGGWDSAACAIICRDQRPDLLFFDYGQTYKDNELKAAKAFAQAVNLPFNHRALSLGHDHPRRNFYLIAEAKRLGYHRIIVGSRNVAPFFDRYKDSNWFSLKLFGWLMGADLRLPITGWLKKKVVSTVRSIYNANLYNCYANKADFLTCQCPNCLEIKRVLLSS